MDPKTGQIYDMRELNELEKEVRDRLIPLSQDTYVKPGDKVGRNDPCPCGSNKKFKKCCHLKEIEAHNKAFEEAQKS